MCAVGRYVEGRRTELVTAEDGDAFADFLKKETARVTDVLKSVGLVKS